ncbi:MAG: class I SAM-dependent methyltransferase [Spirochaetia bacterium]|nr:class I SAM-dependent methyltransferase [Spirochaetia bacterium]
MTKYEGKKYYQSEKVAKKYNTQYEGKLSLRNFRIRLIGKFEELKFKGFLKKVPKNGKVLDIACGTGRYTRILLQNKFIVTATDISKEMIEFTKKNSHGLEGLADIKIADAAKLPFKNNSFDGITCIRLYQRVPHSERVLMLKEIKRLSKDWAIVFFGLENSFLRIRNKVRRFFIKGRPSNPYPATREEMLSEIESAGLKFIKGSWVFPGLASGYISLIDCR